MSDDSASSPSPTTAPYLVINSTLPQTRFDVCWLESVNGGQAWSKLVGCALAIYCWSLSSKKSLWNVLLVHAVTGMLGTLIEDGWVAAANCGFQRPGVVSAASWMLLANEVNWILHESMTVYYSYIKTKVVIRSPHIDSLLHKALCLLFLFFAGARLNIGRLRYSANLLSDPDIELAHNFAFLIWGLADLVLMVLLVLNVLDYAAGRSRSRSRQSRQHRPTTAATTTTTLQQGEFVLKTLLNSSIPRFAVIFANTLLICLVNFVAHYADHAAIGYLTLQNVSKFAWMVKGSYTTLLLLDILMTRFLLFAAGTAGTAGERSLTAVGGEEEDGVRLEAVGSAAARRGAALRSPGGEEKLSSGGGGGGSTGSRPTVILMPPPGAAAGLAAGGAATRNPSVRRLDEARGEAGNGGIGAARGRARAGSAAAAPLLVPIVGAPAADPAAAVRSPGLSSASGGGEVGESEGGDDAWWTPAGPVVGFAKNGGGSGGGGGERGALRRGGNERPAATAALAAPRMRVEEASQPSSAQHQQLARRVLDPLCSGVTLVLVVVYFISSPEPRTLWRAPWKPWEVTVEVGERIKEDTSNRAGVQKASSDGKTNNAIFKQNQYGEPFDQHEVAATRAAGQLISAEGNRMIQHKVGEMGLNDYLKQCEEGVPSALDWQPQVERHINNQIQSPAEQSRRAIEYEYGNPQNKPMGAKAGGGSAKGKGGESGRRERSRRRRSQR
ncbi:hypothetical protein DFJ73DRAFT_950670 [Zopfochytrium polystomum]|nr:hypothetical protein DFJ73DRAFT_950670 [Zopfochytrium polystomum]